MRSNIDPVDLYSTDTAANLQQIGHAQTMILHILTVFKVLKSNVISQICSLLPIFK